MFRAGKHRLIVWLLDRHVVPFGPGQPNAGGSHNWRCRSGLAGIGNRWRQVGTYPAHLDVGLPGHGVSRRLRRAGRPAIRPAPARLESPLASTSPERRQGAHSDRRCRSFAASQNRSRTMSMDSKTFRICAGSRLDNFALGARGRRHSETARPSIGSTKIPGPLALDHRCRSEFAQAALYGAKGNVGHRSDRERLGPELGIHAGRRDSICDCSAIPLRTNVRRNNGKF